jgi:hypothetical protein
LICHSNSTNSAQRLTLIDRRACFDFGELNYMLFICTVAKLNSHM